MCDTSDPAADFDHLSEAYVARLRAGESPSIEEYASAHPALAERIYHLFPVLAAVEGVKPRVAHPAPGLPEAIGGYRVCSEIGRGGMGRVFECESEGTRYAIKVIHSHLLQRRSFRERFVQEASAGMRIEHPAVVRTFDIGTTDDGKDLPFLVMELVRGQNLQELLQVTGPLPERLCLHIAERVAEGLQAMHEAGIVHRDIKPENVVITPDEQIKVMDLGIAFVRDASARLSQTGEFVGSLLYAAPEQLSGRAFDARTDLYGLGLVLHELSTGVHPLRDPKGKAIGVAGSVDGASPRIQRPELSPFFDAFVATLLRADPADRFASAAEASATLREGTRSAWWQQRTRPRPAWLDAFAGDPFAARVPLFGRAPAQVWLDEQWTAAETGQGRVVWLAGAAGVGKSRLLRDWMTRRPEAVSIAAAIHRPQEGGPRVHPVARALAEAVGGDPDGTRLAALLDGSDELASAFDAYVRGAEDGTTAIGAEALSTVLVRLMRALAAEAPLLLVLEDLHCASDAAAHLCLQLARAAEGHRALVILSGRPEQVTPATAAELRRIPGLASLTLEPLDPTFVVPLLESAFRDPPLSATVLGDLARLGGGNPLYLLELGRALHGREDLPSQRTTGGSRTRIPSVPASLLELMEARLSRLGAEERTLLAAASCVGFSFPPLRVAAALGRRRIAALRQFDAMEREHGLLRSEGSEYQFAHQLLREALESGLAAEERAGIHAAIAEAWIAEWDARSEPPEAAEKTAVVLHAMRGTRPELGLPYVRTALDYLGRSGDETALRELTDRGLELIDRIDPAEQAVLYMHAGIVFTHERPGEEILSYFDRALEAADPERQADLMLECRMWRTQALRYLGRYEEALASADAALEVARARGQHEIEAGLHGMAGGVLRQIGRDRDSFARIEASVEAARRAGATDRLCSALNSLAIRHGEAGDPEAAVQVYEEAVEVARRGGFRSREAAAVANSAWCYHVLGRPQEALARASAGEVLAREIGSLLNESRALGRKALAYAAMGQWREAVATMDRLVRMSAAIASDEVRLQGIFVTQEVYVDAGRLELLEKHARETIALGASHSLPRFWVVGHSCLAELHAVTGREDAAREALTEARLGAEQTRIRQGLDRLHRAAQRVHLFHADWRPLRDVTTTWLETDDAGGQPIQARRAQLLRMIAHAELGEAEAALAACHWLRDHPFENVPLTERPLIRAYELFLGEGEAIGARVDLEANEHTLPWWGQIMAWHALARTTGSRSDAERATDIARSVIGRVGTCEVAGRPHYCGLARQVGC